jgi:multidrug transporter EmrE-like cation transporter
MSYVDIGALCLAEIVGDFGLKEFANNGGTNSFATGIIGYVGVIWFLIKSLQGSTVLLVNSAWDGLSALIESAAAFFILGERFADPMQYVGLLLIILGLFFLKLPVVNERKFVLPDFFLQK